MSAIASQRKPNEKEKERGVDAIVSLIQSVGYKAKGFIPAEDFLKSRQLLSRS
jgi:hypothetical protein